MMSFQSSPVIDRNKTTRASDPVRKLTCLNPSFPSSYEFSLAHSLTVFDHPEEDDPGVGIEEDEEEHGGDDEGRPEHTHHHGHHQHFQGAVPTGDGEEPEHDDDVAEGVGEPPQPGLADNGGQADGEVEEHPDEAHHRDQEIDPVPTRLPKAGQCTGHHFENYLKGYITWIKEEIPQRRSRH